MWNIILRYYDKKNTTIYTSIIMKKVKPSYGRLLISILFIITIIYKKKR